MSMRKIASLTALVSFVLEMLTSVILYIVLQGFAAHKITAREAMSIKEIAAENNTSPLDIFELLRQVANQG